MLHACGVVSFCGSDNVSFGLLCGNDVLCEKHVHAEVSCVG